jgi:ABC-type branched-subunit amino acid transport system substrate-binding protein
VVIGPSTDRLAPTVGAALEDTDVVLVSPNPTIGDIGTKEQPWFRMSPGNLTGSTTPALIGEHMARECVNRGAWRVLVATDDDVYDVELANGFKHALTARGGETVTELAAERAQSRKVVDALNRADVDTVVLAMGIVPAARLIADVYASTREVPHWMLTPRLKSDALLLNTPQGALDGAFGVSLRISSRLSGCADASADACFGEAMQEAWGEEAFENTHFMYDAAAVVLIAMDKVLRENAGTVDRSHLNQAIFATAERGGVLIDWNDFPLAVERASVGGSVQYSGVTGPIVFTESGSRVGGNTIVFEVEDHAFVDLDK